MGKYMRKAKITSEVVVMEVSQASLGVRTRARALALQNLQNTSSATSSSYLQLRSRRLEKPVAAEEEAKKPKEGCKQKCSSNSRLGSVSVNSGSVGSVSVSFSTNGEEEGLWPDMEASLGENVLEYEGRERNVRETTPSSLIRDPETLEAPGSTTRRTRATASTRRKQNTMSRIIPSAQEMEEFFASAEQQQQMIFMEKYNYNPISDSPLPGRYEWVTM
ncbi:hypothetical protein MRB53_003778 [Persea americana]|uniref:Uncharacterized protein n=2 Tax=Persea americana TaxID=3435 RepID=A0ACC2MYD2_PERAE|nr:cyclin-dependent kinase inhibitor [Persea americana]KAJ8650755.1 hypothetical protein MRB53_003778 [Persea americana]|eukprot:TRINITY_DN6190_c1_g1_i3.p1 TRINITY_DN6190_c1_g1~~TRINITY_DN6190_c1_g1_i3.p1  ORF type:complete len:219 (-),score=52.54 TRINITY_DN6190_c1_g1_i3:332-988(-)